MGEVVSQTPEQERYTASQQMLRKMNEVDGFFPETLLKQYINPDGKPFAYLTVPCRISWFRLKNPEGSIITSIESLSTDYVCFRCKIYLEKGNESSLIATGSAIESFNGGGVDRTAFAKAETAAVGRALAIAGYGTTNCGDELFEGEIPVDAPQEALKGTLTEGIDSESVIDSEEDAAETEFEKKLNKTTEELDKRTISGIMITYGPLAGKMAKAGINKANTDDAVAALRGYAYPEKPDFVHIREIAACRYIVDKYDSSKLSPPVQQTLT